MKGILHNDPSDTTAMEVDEMGVERVLGMGGVVVGMGVGVGVGGVGSLSAARERHAQTQGLGAKGQGLGALALVVERRKLVAGRLSRLIAQVITHPVNRLY